MTNRIRTLALASMTLGLMAAPLAAQGKGHGNKGHEGKGKDERVVVAAPGNVVVDGRTYGNGRKVPPGLAKKPGGLPPGIAKKMYSPDRGVSVLRDVFGQNGYTVVRTANAGDMRYVYYRGTDGRLRRAVVQPGAQQLQFGNVPASILQAVLAQLY